MSVFGNKTITLADGARVLLRSPEVDEAGQLLEYLDAVRRETNGILYSPEDTIPSLEEETAWVRGKRDCKVGTHIAADVDGTIVGLAGIDQPKFARQHHIGSVGISIRKAWCDRGLGTLIMRELIEYARREPALEILTLNVLSTNPRAHAVYRKVGFKDDGRLPGRIKLNGEYVDLCEMSLCVNEMGAAS
jgi:RimJ/RimL family protein N-acetyltransferase